MALLKGKLRENNLTQAEFARRIGISLSRFNAKINQKRGAEFSLGEVQAMRSVLGLSLETVEDIFFN